MKYSERLKATIVIPCTDSEVIPLILDALQIQVNEVGNTEVVVVGSDRRHLVRPGGCVRFLPTGAEAACASDKRNLGIQTARGDYLLFLDDDCIPDPGWLRHLLRHLEDGKPVVGGAVRFDRKNYLQMSDNLSAFHDLMPYTRCGDRSYLATASLGVSRAVIEQVGLMPPGRNRADDLEWTQQMRRKGFPLYFEPGACIFHDPPRRNIAAVWQHWIEDAPHTLRVRLQYADTLKTPHLTKSRRVFLWGAPIIAAWATARTYEHWRTWYDYAHALPLVYLTKIAWCWSAYTNFHQIIQQVSRDPS